ncbi:guanine nucleotide-binding protein subunit beta-like protein 1 isoform X2 [Onychomys torridus]|uniref:guanine nucleotide-binding protein subunit beta-like protein 1 isoform X2 n=1 Tax=Onychomys torridus TaxID=38674 RepID=UPI00167FDCD9|nr:guanine nucleotide-binding protein subunit beta-like protein 1 isoform X2 [Onychomys torridus]
MAGLFPPPPGPRFVLRGTQSPVNTLHFCPASQALGNPLLFSGSQSGLVHIWSLQTRRIVATLNGHRSQGVTWLRTLPQGHQLLSQGRDLQLCLWDLAEGRNTIIDSVQLDSVGFCKSSILARGQLCWMLAVPGKGSDEVQILEMPSKTSVCTLKPEADAKPGMPMCLGLWQLFRLEGLGPPPGAAAKTGTQAVITASGLESHVNSPRPFQGEAFPWPHPGVQDSGTHKSWDCRSHHPARPQDFSHSRLGPPHPCVSLEDNEATGCSGLPHCLSALRGLRHRWLACRRVQGPAYQHLVTLPLPLT